MAIASQLRSDAKLGKMRVSHRSAAGLLKPSAIKPVFATIEQSLVIRKLGVLSAADQSTLVAGLATVLG